jgi:hypothetical protein
MSDIIFKKNLELVSKSLINKNIIYSTQYISDEDTQIDGDGPQSSWNIVVLCIEKTDDDYIFNFFRSEYLRSYSYPYFAIINKFHPFNVKLSNLKANSETISEKKSNEISNYIEMFNNHYSYGFKCTDQDLHNELKSLSLQIDFLEEILTEKYKKERDEEDKNYQEYLKSDEYKEMIKRQKEYDEKLKEEYRIKEDERLKLWTDQYGVEKGTQFFNRL